MTGSPKLKLRTALFILSHDGPASSHEETTARRAATEVVGEYLVGDEERELRSLWKGHRNPSFLRKLDEIKARLLMRGDL